VIVFFTLDGVSMTQRVAATNANFARVAVERDHPGARVYLMLPVNPRPFRKIEK
jgi:hypothetical protein